MSTQRFDIRHAPAPRESFRLLYISKSRFGGDWNSTTHTHSCTELFYCLSGEGQFYLAGQLFPVKPDDMVIVNPQVEHTELSLNASPLEYIVLGVASMEFLFSKADTNYAIFNCRENRERMVTLLHMLLAEADRSLHPGQAVSVYIKNILPDKMKIKLVVVNKNLAQPLRFEPHYFVTRGRIKKWTYSTPQSRKQIETVF